jgi:Excreted virulence factor EspC, type VII ESX diderm
VSAPVLKVDAAVLGSVGAQFDQAGTALAALHADTPLSDAAAGVAQLATGHACTQAQATIATQMTALAEGARTYGANLKTAAAQYQSGDQSSASALGAVDFSK